MQSQVAIGEDIIKAYKPYRRSPEQPLKMFTVGVNKFEVDPKYELGQIRKAFPNLSRTGSIRGGCSRQGH